MKHNEDRGRMMQRLISEGSYDTEAWSKDAEISGMNYILNIYFTLVRIREFLQKPYRRQT